MGKSGKLMKRELNKFIYKSTSSRICRCTLVKSGKTMKRELNKFIYPPSRSTDAHWRTRENDEARQSWTNPSRSTGPIPSQIFAHLIFPSAENLQWNYEFPPKPNIPQNLGEVRGKEQNTKLFRVANRFSYQYSNEKQNIQVVKHSRIKTTTSSWRPYDGHAWLCPLRPKLSRNP